MSNEVKLTVRFSDDDHAWIAGHQWISLSRFIQVKNDTMKEMKLLQERVLELEQENTHLRGLLKERL
jgi:hypothetical protein